MSLEFRDFERIPAREFAESGAVVREFFGAVDSDPEQSVSVSSPQAFCADFRPGYVEAAHFHDVDQFQLFFGQGDSFFLRKKISKLVLQYADAYSTYGPFGSQESGLRFYTLRARHSSIRAYMPKDRDKLKRRGRRQWSVDLQPFMDRDPRDSASVEPLCEREADGLAAYWIELPSGTTVSAPLAEGTGQYFCVISGTIDSDGDRYGMYSLGWMSALEASVPVRLQATGSEPASVLIVQLP